MGLGAQVSLDLLSRHVLQAMWRDSRRRRRAPRSVSAAVACTAAERWANGATSRGPARCCTCPRPLDTTGDQQESQRKDIASVFIASTPVLTRRLLLEVVSSPCRELVSCIHQELSVWWTSACFVQQQELPESSYFPSLLIRSAVQSAHARLSPRYIHWVHGYVSWLDHSTGAGHWSRAFQMTPALASSFIHSVIHAFTHWVRKDNQGRRPTGQHPMLPQSRLMWINISKSGTGIRAVSRL